MLLWGSRGMGKSALLRAAYWQRKQPSRADRARAGRHRCIGRPAPAVCGAWAKVERNFLVFIDDLGFAEGDSVGPRHLRSWLEGGVEARPANVRLAVTSNRRAIVSREASEQDDPLNPRDAVDDRLALADRFGLVARLPQLQPGRLSRDRRAAMPKNMGFAWDEADALEWSKRRGARSGRTAWQFVTELAGRAGKPL